MKAPHPVKWFKAQSLPIKVGVVIVALWILGRLILRPAQLGASGARSSLHWDPAKYTAGGRWGGL
jgi:hypothetical protein